jgi:lipopolysaccharide transport system ATP-binding protein
MSSVIKIENLWKEYRLGVIGHGTLTRDLESWWAKVRGKEDPNAKIAPMLAGQEKQIDGDHFWALRDISFDVKQGEILGIIGKNGAGKSTLLKILSRVTAPTKGDIKIKGRIASLLEVGTGFHPELTGRQNIFINGAILGMSKDEVQRKLDEIVDFSGIEDFIDTPVKRYSSGMYVRLAFSVAAHLEPEILILDEVLAVGDAEFQKKCLGKMGEVSREGRTILFVSHNIIAVRNLCTRIIWLKGGKVYRSGETMPVSEEYLRQAVQVESYDDISQLIKTLPDDPAFQMLGVTIQQDGQEGNVVVNGRPVTIEIKYRVLETTTGLRVYFDLLDDESTILIRSFHDDDAEAVPTVVSGEYVSSATIPANLLAPRRYILRIQGTVFNVRTCTGAGVIIPLIVEASSDVNRGYPQDTIRSKIQPMIPWLTNTISN